MEAHFHRVYPSRQVLELIGELYADWAHAQRALPGSAFCKALAVSGRGGRPQLLGGSARRPLRGALPGAAVGGPEAEGLRTASAR